MTVFGQYFNFPKIGDCLSKGPMGFLAAAPTHSFEMRNECGSDEVDGSGGMEPDSWWECSDGRIAASLGVISSWSARKTGRRFRCFGDSSCREKVVFPLRGAAGMEKAVFKLCREWNVQHSLLWRHRCFSEVSCDRKVSWCLCVNQSTW